jgi:hypothetical protein
MDSTMSERLNEFKCSFIKGEFDRAKEKVDDNLYLIKQNIRELQEYLFKIGSRGDNRLLIKKAYIFTLILAMISS